MKQNHLLSVRNVTVMAMFGALAAVLMIFEVPLPFIAPSFYGMDISEVPVLVGTFALGPVAGVVMELVKILDCPAVRYHMSLKSPVFPKNFFQ